MATPTLEGPDLGPLKGKTLRYMGILVPRVLRKKKKKKKNSKRIERGPRKILLLQDAPDPVIVWQKGHTARGALLVGVTVACSSCRLN